MITLHSPDGVFETGLLGCPPEKKAATLADSNEQDTFSGPVWEQKLSNYGNFLRRSMQSPANPSPREIPANREKYREFLYPGAKNTHTIPHIVLILLVLLVPKR